MVKIDFQGTSATYPTKKRKRVPGAIHRMKPEVKAYNPFDPAAAEDVYNSIQIVNMSRLPAGTNGYFPSNFPIAMAYPDIGGGANNRIGNRILMRYLKIKGYIYLREINPQISHWRLCLIRTANIDNTEFRNDWLSYFQYAVYYTPATLPDDVDTIQSFAVHNFYKKMKDPDVAMNFKYKVLASGSLPKTFNSTFGAETAISSNPGLTKTVVHTNPNSTKNSAAWFPINITVTCNDNMQVGQTYYWLVLETDTANGFQYSAVGTYNAQGVPVDCRNNSNIDYRTWGFNFYCKAYFQDP